MRWLAPFVLLATSVLAQQGAADAQDGAALFAGGPGLQARLGRPDGPILLQGQFSCAGCHGADGRGGAEGGTQPAPPIDWASLAAPTPERPAYDEATFARLLAQGITPSGRVISARMPRFSGAPLVIAALAAHLRTLDDQERLGLSPVDIAVTLPRDPGARNAALAAIAAFNADGGSFGRQVKVGEPAFLDLEATLAVLLPRLHQAEDARLHALLVEDTGLRPPDDTTALRIAGTIDQLGPHLPAILARGAEVHAIGPTAEAMAWATGTGQDGDAAHAYAAVRGTLNLLRDQGRDLTRSRFDRAVADQDLDTAVQTYRQP